MKQGDSRPLKKKKDMKAQSSKELEGRTMEASVSDEKSRVGMCSDPGLAKMRRALKTSGSIFKKEPRRIGHLME